MKGGMNKMSITDESNEFVGMYGTSGIDLEVENGRVSQMVQMKKRADRLVLEADKSEFSARRYMNYCLAGDDYYKVGFLDKAQECYEMGLTFHTVVKSENGMHGWCPARDYLREMIMETKDEQEKLGKKRVLRKSGTSRSNNNCLFNYGLK